MRVQTFVGKVSSEGLRLMDDQINHWLETKGIEPKFVSQVFGKEPHREVTSEEPVVITSIWY